MTRELDRWIKAHVARAALPPSSVRGKGSGGVAKAGREFLNTIDLSAFGERSKLRFSTALDRSTEALLLALPRGGRHWGLARKMLNLFLRDALYNVHLERRYGLSAHEEEFEVPLDSFTGTKIRELACDTVGPWNGVRALRSEESAKYQAAARVHALKREVARVHLDAAWWGEREDD